MIISLIAVFCAFNIATDALADPVPYSLEQETYLLQKTPASGPWTSTTPDGSKAFGKLEYFNYAVGEGFSFDFKGYDFGVDVYVDGIFDDVDGDADMPANGSYALIYYVDPDPEDLPWNPDVYVLGISTDLYVPTSKGEAKGLVGVDIKICGSCDIGQIPVVEDVNYPNGGKIWLVPVGLLDNTEPCTWTTMIGWDSAGILFETSLITYSFVEVE
jgi:hypothetical protein